MFTLCVLFGKFCAAGAYKILYIATAELYPTAIRLNLFSTPTYVCTTQPEICNHPSDRNSMLGVCSTIARVGGIAAPWVAVYLPDQVLNLTLDLVDPQPSFRGRDL